MEFLILSVNWGSISDWVMIAVTITTATFLYKTLKSQKEVQSVQNKLFRIEQARFNESIKPILRYSASTDKMIPSDKDKKILTIKVINETEYAALRISKVLSPREKSSQIFVPTGFSDQKDHLVKGDNPLLYHFLIDGSPSASNWIYFELIYEDIYNNKYRQKVICLSDNIGVEINPYLPEIIRE